MFYPTQSENSKNNYKRMLAIVGELTRLFADDKTPYLPYRCQENIFCKYFEAENLGRRDCSADAKKGDLGIGLKTWRGNDDQKVAEFGKLKENYKNKEGLDLVKTISEYRNKRIQATKKIYGLNEMIYHIIKRVPDAMKILECAFDEIDIDNIVIEKRGNANNTYFSDGKHIYHFSTSKNTLYMIFDEMTELDSFEVEIIEDPFSYLLNNTETAKIIETEHPETDTICLRLYTIRKGEKVVSEKSGLNQWNASGRKRGENELYIPYPIMDRRRNPNFFPPREESFELQLPNGKIFSAKVCQDGGKAIMSNPNSELGEWLLREVFALPEGKLLTYEMLKILDIDSVIFKKLGDKKYSIDFAPVGTYEKYYHDEYADLDVVVED